MVSVRHCSCKRRAQGSSGFVSFDSSNFLLPPLVKSSQNPDHGAHFATERPLVVKIRSSKLFETLHTDVDMRQVSCTNLTVNDSNIVSTINLKQNIIDTTKDVQMRNLTCKSVKIGGIDVISSLDSKQDTIQDISDALDSVSDSLASIQDTLNSDSYITVKSLVVGGLSSNATQAIGPILSEPIL